MMHRVFQAIYPTPILERGRDITKSLDTHGDVIHHAELLDPRQPTFPLASSTTTDEACEAKLSELSSGPLKEYTFVKEDAGFEVIDVTD